MELNKATLEFMLVWYIKYGDGYGPFLSDQMPECIRRVYVVPGAKGFGPLYDGGYIEFYMGVPTARLTQKGVEAVQRYIVTMAEATAEPMGVAEAEAEAETENE